MADGFKDKNDKFHPTGGSQKAVSKESIEKDQMMDNPGNNNSDKKIKTGKISDDIKIEFLLIDEIKVEADRANIS